MRLLCVGYKNCGMQNQINQTKISILKALLSAVRLKQFFMILPFNRLSITLTLLWESTKKGRNWGKLGKRK